MILPRLFSKIPLLAFTVLMSAIPCGAQSLNRSEVVKHMDAPVASRELAEGHWFFDFGKATFGNVEIGGRGLPANATVRVHMGEALAADGTVNRSPGGTVRYQSHEVKLSASGAVSPRLTWAPPGWMKDGWTPLPPNTGEMMPFRYVEIENAPPAFKAEHIRRITWHVAFDDKAADFSSSSPELDSVWELCKHSIKATTFMGLYVDGDRERKPYEADVLINQLAHYCLEPQYETARLTHEYLLDHPTWPTEWRLQSVILAWHDFLWSGSDQSLRRHYATLVSRAMIEQRTDEGFFIAPKRDGITDIVDWPAGERDSYDMNQPVKTVVTAFHYRALVHLADIATHLGKRDDARRFKEMADATLKAVNEKLWDESRGCYVDGLDPATGKRSGHVSAHANFFPLALGMVPDERVEKVASYLEPRGMACSVYGAQFLLDGLYDAGRADAALALLVSDGLRSWRNMSEKVGSTITLESWDPSLKPNLDWNHAWGAAPAAIIPRKLMGIEPLEPGFTRFRVRPQTASLEQARIKMPTPKGPVHMAVSGTTAETWETKLVVPNGTTAEFHMPFPGEPKIAGERASTARVLRTEGESRVVELPAGIWTITVE